MAKSFLSTTSSRFGGNCHSFNLFCLFQLHTLIITFIRIRLHSPRPLSPISSLLVCSVGKACLGPGVPSQDFNPGLLYSRPAALYTNWATLHPVCKFWCAWTPRITERSKKYPERSITERGRESPGLALLADIWLERKDLGKKIPVSVSWQNVLARKLKCSLLVMAYLIMYLKLWTYF